MQGFYVIAVIKLNVPQNSVMHRSKHPEIINAFEDFPDPVLQALPGTQGIYGLLVAFLILVKIGVMGGSPVDLTMEQGLYFLFAGIPIGLVGIASGYAQGKTCAAGIMMVAKRSDQLAKGLIFGAMVETYAILALLISFLLWNFAPM